MIVRKKTRFTREQFSKKLRARHQLNRAVSGLNAKVVFNTKSDFVYKIMPDDEAEGYRAFVVAAMKRQHNPWFPKIYQATVYKCGEESYFVVKMEKLKKIKEDHPVAKYSFELHYDTIDQDRTQGETERVDALQVYFDCKLFQDLQGVLRYLYKKFMPDLHSGNVMIRPSSNHPVVIDPIQ